MLLIKKVISLICLITLVSCGEKDSDSNNEVRQEKDTVSKQKSKEVASKPIITEEDAEKRISKLLENKVIDLNNDQYLAEIKINSSEKQFASDYVKCLSNNREKKEALKEKQQKGYPSNVCMSTTWIGTKAPSNCDKQNSDAIIYESDYEFYKQCPKIELNLKDIELAGDWHFEWSTLWNKSDILKSADHIELISGFIFPSNETELGLDICKDSDDSSICPSFRGGKLRYFEKPQLTNDEARAYCDSIGFGWRLPSDTEISSLISSGVLESHLLKSGFWFVPETDDEKGSKLETKKTVCFKSTNIGPIF